MSTCIDLHVEALVVELDAHGRLDEAAVRRAVASALQQSGDLAGLGAGSVVPIVAHLVADRVTHEVRGAVPPC